MRIKQQSLATTVSLRPYLQRVVFAALFLCSLFLLYSERQDNQLVNSVRLAVLDVTLPVVETLASPIAALEDAGARWDRFWLVYADNERLRGDNAQLLQWRASALRLEAENRALRQLLDYQPVSRMQYTTAKVLGVAYGNVTQRMQLNRGADAGLKPHLAVINEHGLIGRILHVSDDHAELLLLSDMSSRVPVELQPSGLRGILIGDHHGLPYLKLADPKAKPQLGDTVLTSGDGQVLPAGLYIGKLFAEQDGRWQVRPAFREKRLDFVRVVRPVRP